MSETSKQEQTISLSALKELLADQARQNAELASEQSRLNEERTLKLIQELRKPTVLEQKKLDQEAQELITRNQDRKENAQGQLQLIANRRALQRICSHKHRGTNQSHCVWIQELAPSPGYLLCQLNQCKIRPGVAPKDYKGDDIYDTDMFNRVFQELPSNEMFG